VKLEDVVAGLPDQVPVLTEAFAVELKMSAPVIPGARVTLGVAETTRVVAEALAAEPWLLVAV
jgi:hypothetical protein